MDNSEIEYSDEHYRLGSVAYEAVCNHTEGVYPSGNPRPCWAALTEDEQRGWASVANAICADVIQHGFR